MFSWPALHIFNICLPLWCYSRSAVCLSLVFEEDVEYIGLVLEVLRVFQQQGQRVVVDGSAGISRDAAL